MLTPQQRRNRTLAAIVDQLAGLAGNDVLRGLAGADKLFGGDGEITVEDEQLILDFGNDITGVTWKDAKVLPKINYEITLDAKLIG